MLDLRRDGWERLPILFPAEGGSGSGTSSAASSSLVVETSFVLKTLDPARMFEPTGLMIDHTLYDTLSSPTATR